MTARSPLGALLAGVPELRSTRRLFKRRIREVLNETGGADFDEAAFPSYAHGNPLIDFLVWRKWMLAWALAAPRPGQVALDFGCGPGMMSFSLARARLQVVALDMTLAPLRKLAEGLEFPAGIRFVEGTEDDIPVHEEGFDTIFALDVLEHVNDLGATLDTFRQRLRGGGKLVVSAPTESRLYALGRRLAGPEFTGDYHVRGAAEILREVAERFEVKRRVRIVWPAVLFEVFEAVT